MEKGAWNHSDPGVTGSEGRFTARIPSGIFSQQLLHTPARTAFLGALRVTAVY